MLVFFKENLMVMDINVYIWSLIYNLVEMFNVNNMFGDLVQKVLGELNIDIGLLDCGYCIICVSQFYELDRDFLEIVIFNLGSGNVYFGVLVLANVDLLFGIFCLLGLEWNLVMLIIDLFGIGDKGFFIVVDLLNVMVSFVIDEVLEYWNNIVFQQGYFNGVCFYYEASEVFE